MRFGFVSTYPPTQCGLATFTSSLMTAMIDGQDHTGYDDTASVIRLLEFPGRPRGFDDPAAEVVGTMVAGDPQGPAAAAMLLSSCDVVIIQHEYGIFGGHDGDEVLKLLTQLTGAVDRRAAHRADHAHRPPTSSAGIRRPAGLRRRHHDQYGAGSARRRLSHRPGEGPGDPARIRRHRRSLRAHRVRRTPDRADLGIDRARQGHRVGHRGDEPAARPASRTPVRGGRPDPPEGAGERR